jgi:uncharacterized protein YhhL (DUF1145 family)
MSLLSVSYLVYLRPFETPQQNFVEVFNELMVLIGSYHMLMFTSLDPI